MMKIKEYGSDFHFPIDEKWLLKKTKNSFFEWDKLSLFFSGRSSIYHLLHFGIEHFSWEKVYFPSYYCHEVVDFLRSLPISIEYYDFNPFLNEPVDFELISDKSDSVFINVSFFGSNKMDLSCFQNLVIVDDVTHNLLSYKESQANYCIGSLRKELPVPMGGFCYSPQNKPLPESISNEESNLVAKQRVKAMQLKKDYLEENHRDKSLFRSIFINTEDKFEQEFTRSNMPELAQSILFQLDVFKILEAKKKNTELAFKILQDVPTIKGNFAKNQFGHDFGLTILCESENLRNDLRSLLISNNIYPAILWPNQFNRNDIELENRVLFVHMDFRYSEEDVTKMIQIIKTYFNND